MARGLPHSTEIESRHKVDIENLTGQMQNLTMAAKVAMYFAPPFDHSFARFAAHLRRLQLLFVQR
jgi:hypothetical protein